MDAEREKRVAQNESIFRLVNEQIEGGNVRSEVTEEQEYVCECGNVRCTDRVYMTSDEYRRVRSNARRFFVIPGHDLPDVETVAERHERYAVVEKFGVGGAVAEAHDPRSM